MFDRLVISVRDCRPTKTRKILFLTSALYSLTIASALVVSVVAASPVISEKVDVTKLAGPPLLPHADPPPQGPRPIRPLTNQRAAATSSIYNPAKLDQITDPTAQRTLARVMPNLTNVDGDFPANQGGNTVGSPHGDSLVTNGILQGTGRELETPPPPPVKPRPEPPQVQQQPLRLSSTVLTGKAVERKTPVYTAMLRQLRLQGSITVEIVISPEGRIESARALGGHPMLVNASLEAARGWRFEPTLLNGVPVRVTGVITFHFKLD